MDLAKVKSGQILKSPSSQPSYDVHVMAQPQLSTTSASSACPASATKDSGILNFRPFLNRWLKDNPASSRTAPALASIDLHLYGRANRIPAVRPPTFIYPDAQIKIAPGHLSRWREVVKLLSCNVDECDKLRPYSSRINYGLHMCGPEPQKAFPHIVVTCPRQLVRSLRCLFKQDNVRRHYHVKYLGTDSQLPGFGLVFVGVEDKKIFGRVHDVVLSTFVANEKRHTMCGVRVMSTPTSDRYSTIGCLLQVGERAYGLTTRHTFEDNSIIDVTDEASGLTDIDDDDDDYEYDFDGLEAVEQEFEARTEAEGGESGPSNSSSTSDLHGLPHTSPGDASSARFMPAKIHMIAEDSPFTDEDLDWALVELGDESHWLPNEYSGEALHYQRLRVSQEVVEELPMSSREVYIISSKQSASKGKINSWPLLTGAGHASIMEIWNVSPEPGETLKSGDSGSLVVDATTHKVYGHVVSINHFGDLNVIPMTKVIPQVRLFTNNTSVGLFRAPEAQSLPAVGQPIEVAKNSSMLLHRANTLLPSNEEPFDSNTDDPSRQEQHSKKSRGFSKTATMSFDFEKDLPAHKWHSAKHFVTLSHFPVDEEDRGITRTPEASSGSTLAPGSRKHSTGPMAQLVNDDYNDISSPRLESLSSKRKAPHLPPASTSSEAKRSRTLDHSDPREKTFQSSSSVEAGRGRMAGNGAKTRDRSMSRERSSSRPRRTVLPFGCPFVKANPHRYEAVDAPCTRVLGIAPTMKHLMEHLKKNHSSEYRCMACLRLHKSQKDFMAHQDQEAPWKCHDCCKTFGGGRDYEVHKMHDRCAIELERRPELFSAAQEEAFKKMSKRLVSGDGTEESYRMVFKSLFPSHPSRDTIWPFYDYLCFTHRLPVELTPKQLNDVSGGMRRSPSPPSSDWSSMLSTNPMDPSNSWGFLSTIRSGRDAPSNYDYRFTGFPYEADPMFSNTSSEFADLPTVAMTPTASMYQQVPISSTLASMFPDAQGDLATSMQPYPAQHLTLSMADVPGPLFQPMGPLGATALQQERDISTLVSSSFIDRDDQKERMTINWNMMDRADQESGNQ